ncbi:hypothetical protein [Paenibacillus sp. CMAA1364]
MQSARPWARQSQVDLLRVCAEVTIGVPSPAVLSAVTSPGKPKLADTERIWDWKKSNK